MSFLILRIHLTIHSLNKYQKSLLCARCCPRPGRRRETETERHACCLGATQPVRTAGYKQGNRVKYTTRWYSSKVGWSCDMEEVVREAYERVTSPTDLREIRADLRVSGGAASPRPRAWRGEMHTWSVKGVHGPLHGPEVYQLVSARAGLGTWTFKFSSPLSSCSTTWGGPILLPPPLI